MYCLNLIWYMCCIGGARSHAQALLGGTSLMLNYRLLISCNLCCDVLAGVAARLPVL